jgi:hypothetical protein
MMYNKKIYTSKNLANNIQNQENRETIHPKEIKW